MDHEFDLAFELLDTAIDRLQLQQYGTTTIGHETGGNGGGCGNGPSPHEDSGRSGGGTVPAPCQSICMAAIARLQQEYELLPEFELDMDF